MLRVFREPKLQIFGANSKLMDFIDKHSEFVILYAALISRPEKYVFMVYLMNLKLALGTSQLLGLCPKNQSVYLGPMRNFWEPIKPCNCKDIASQFMYCVFHYVSGYLHRKFCIGQFDKN